MSEFDKEVMWAVSGTGDDFQCVHVDFAREQQAEIDRLREALKAIPPPVWQSLDNAPKDKPFLAMGLERTFGAGHYFLTIGRWTGSHFAAKHDGSMIIAWLPTPDFDLSVRR